MQIRSSLSRGGKHCPTVPACRLRMQEDGRGEGSCSRKIKMCSLASVAVHRDNVDSRAPPKMALSEFDVALGTS
jgi:hypothetical protein